MRVVWLLALVACTSSDIERRPLADMRQTKAYIQANDTYGALGTPAFFVLNLDTPDCAGFSPDTVVTFAGQSLTITDPSRDDLGNCVMAQAELGAIAPNVVTSQPAVVNLADPTDVWTIAFTGLDSTDLQFAGPLTAGQTATLVWVDGPPILNGCVIIYDDNDWPATRLCKHDAGFRVAGNTVEVDIPTLVPLQAQIELQLVGEFDLGAVAARGASGLPRCDGPAACSIELSDTRSVNLPIAHTP